MIRKGFPTLSLGLGSSKKFQNQAIKRPTQNPTAAQKPVRIPCREAVLGMSDGAIESEKNSPAPISPRNDNRQKYFQKSKGEERRMEAIGVDLPP